jgi:hypothetical protein
VISFILGYGVHWISYYAFHPGELLCEKMAHTHFGKNRPASFTCYIDGLGPGKDAGLASFLVFILEVTLLLKKWITVILNQPKGEPMVSPNLLQICDNSLLCAMNKLSIFSEKPAETCCNRGSKKGGHHCKGFESHIDFKCGRGSWTNG